MKAIALIPAYNASKTIRSIIERIPRDIIGEVLVLDDGSTDDTLQVLQGLKNIEILRHEKNRGYGAAQMTLYQAALSHPHDYSVILHADGGHFPEEIPSFLETLSKEKADVVVGSRTQGILRKAPSLFASKYLGAIFKGPMPAHKFVANLALTWIQNLLLGTNFHSFHCGFRGCNRKTVEEINWSLLSNWYLFDMEFLLHVHRAGKKIIEIPVDAFYDPNAGSSVPGIRYGLGVLGFSFKQFLKRFSRTS